MGRETVATQWAGKATAEVFWCIFGSGYICTCTPTPKLLPSSMAGTIRWIQRVIFWSIWTHWLRSSRTSETAAHTLSFLPGASARARAGGSGSKGEGGARTRVRREEGSGEEAVTIEARWRSGDSHRAAQAEASPVVTAAGRDSQTGGKRGGPRNCNSKSTPKHKVQPPFWGGVSEAALAV